MVVVAVFACVLLPLTTATFVPSTEFLNRELFEPSAVAAGARARAQLNSSASAGLEFDTVLASVDDTLFSHMQSGDVTPYSIILMVRVNPVHSLLQANDTASVTYEGGDAGSNSWTHSGYKVNGVATIFVGVGCRQRGTTGAPHRVRVSACNASPNHDFVCKVRVTRLPANSQCSYRFAYKGTVSRLSSFVTPPTLKGAPSAFRFAASGDMQYGAVTLNPTEIGWDILSAMSQEGADFNLLLGDQVYQDHAFTCGLSPSPVPSCANTALAQFRSEYKVQYDNVPQYRDYFASAAQVVQFDDHEVVNDWANNVDSNLFAHGLLSFFENTPTDNLPGSSAVRVKLPRSPTCIADPFVRVFNWGPSASFIVLDTHTCRLNTVANCAAVNPAGRELFPHLLQPLRAAAMSSLFPNQPVPPVPTGCAESFLNQSCTVLGAAQEQFLFEWLLDGHPGVKVVLTSTPITEELVLPYSRWETCTAERRRVLQFIADHGLRNKVVFVTADAHESKIQPVYIDSVVDWQLAAIGVPSPKAQAPVGVEFTVGPVNVPTNERLYSLFGLQDAYREYFNLLPTFCFNSLHFGYGLFSYDPSTRTFSASLRGTDKQPLPNELVGPAPFPRPDTCQFSVVVP